MELTADKDVTVTSCKDRITIAAKEEILLNVGGGAYIRMRGGNIDVHCPGIVSVKGAEHVVSGPASMPAPLPVFPLDKTQLHIKREYHDQEALQGAEYIATFADGSTRSGVLDSEGQAQLDDVPPGAVQVRFGPDARAYKRKDQQATPGYKTKLSSNDIQALIAKHGGN